MLIVYVLNFSVSASEYRAWMLFYSVPVLYGILDESYLQHYILLAEAIWILLLDSISKEQLTHADKLLKLFCLQFAAFYGMHVIEIRIV